MVKQVPTVRQEAEAIFIVRCFRLFSQQAAASQHPVSCLENQLQRGQLCDPCTTAIMHAPELKRVSGNFLISYPLDLGRVISIVFLGKRVSCLGFRSPALTSVDTGISMTVTVSSLLH